MISLNLIPLMMPYNQIFDGFIWYMCRIPNKNELTFCLVNMRFIYGLIDVDK